MEKKGGTSPQSKAEEVDCQENCFGCKMVGVGTLSGVSLYMAYLRSATPKADPRTRAFYMVFGGGAAAFAVYHGLYN